jgi:hypothetical protein
MLKVWVLSLTVHDHLAAVVAGVDQHLGDVALHAVEGGDEHAARVDAGGVDVIVTDLDQGLVEDLEGDQVVVALHLGRGVPGAARTSALTHAERDQTWAVDGRW